MDPTIQVIGGGVIVIILLIAGGFLLAQKKLLLTKAIAVLCIVSATWFLFILFSEAVRKFPNGLAIESTEYGSYNIVPCPYIQATDGVFHIYVPLYKQGDREVKFHKVPLEKTGKQPSEIDLEKIEKIIYVAPEKIPTKILPDKIILTEKIPLS